MRTNHKSRKSVLGALSFVVLVAAVASGLAHLCNWLLPPLGVAPISFFGALGIVVLVQLARILFGRGGHGARAKRRHFEAPAASEA